MRLLSAVLLLLASALVHAQAYPTKPVRLIIPFPPGGSNDLVGRAVGAQLGERLGQSVLIDNRGGGGGTIGINAAAKSA
ncbi:MAG TPA: ABC transporter substrate-binding protein, partial [Burkholderiales bacterium]|nr:ABC transporter substrate-binding protein [Burkholderiales bacterium]